MRSSTTSNKPPKADDAKINAQKGEHAALTRSASGSGLAAVRSASSAAVGSEGNTACGHARPASRSSSKGHGPGSAHSSRSHPHGPPSARSSDACSIDSALVEEAVGGGMGGSGTERAQLEVLPEPPELSPSLLDLPTLLAGSGVDSAGRPRSPTTAIAAAFSSLQDAHGQLRTAYLQCLQLYRDARSKYAALGERARAVSVGPSLPGPQAVDHAPQLAEQQEQITALQEAVAALTLKAEEQTQAHQVACSERDAALGRCSSLQMQIEACEASAGQLREEGERRDRELSEARDREAQAQTLCAHKSEEAASAVARAERAERECSEARARAVSLVAQASAAQLAQQEGRRQLALEKAEVVKLKAALAGKGCDRCRSFDLPELEGSAQQEAGSATGDTGPGPGSGPGQASEKEREEYLAALRTVPKHGQWFSVDAVKGALGEAMSLRLVVLAPTVKITLTMPPGPGPGPGPGPVPGQEATALGEGREAAIARLDALAGVPVSSLVRTLEDEVMPRFACVLTVPRLRLKDKGRGAGPPPPPPPPVVPVPIPESMSSQASLDGWLKAMVKQMEGEVQEALAGSGLFKGGMAGGTGTGAATYTTGSTVQ